MRNADSKTGRECGLAKGITLRLREAINPQKYSFPRE
jgi:hypothetical protein